MCMGEIKGGGNVGKHSKLGTVMEDEVGEAGGVQTAHCKDLGFQLFEMGPLKGLSRVT